MTKQEFLESLRTALTGRVSPSAVEENIRYYTDYINTQVRMGKSEEQVISELGDPRLLARSIADADKRAGRTHVDEAAQTGSRQNATGGNAYGSGYGMGGRTYRMPVWLVLLLIGLVFILILGTIFSVLSVLAPLLLPIILIVLVFRLLSRRQ